jgi:hypothetical protein
VSRSQRGRSPERERARERERDSETARGGREIVCCISQSSLLLDLTMPRIVLLHIEQYVIKYQLSTVASLR